MKQSTSMRNYCSKILEEIAALESEHCEEAVFLFVHMLPYTEKVRVRGLTLRQVRSCKRSRALPLIRHRKRSQL